MFQLFSAARGVHPKGSKNTAEMPSMLLDDFTKVQIPMSMHIGAPCQPLVKAGDDIAIGQKIGDSPSYMCVPIHAGISGTVTAVRKFTDSMGKPGEYIEIRSDGLNRIHESVQPPVVADRASFLKAIRESGLVGLGGASFPTHVKMNPPAGKEPDVLVINAAECEPFITSDYRLILERPEEIIEGILAALQWLDIPRAVIGVEDNKADGASLLEFHIDKSDCSGKVSVKLLKTLYPQGAEKPLIFSTTGRKVPTGGLPHDVRVLVLNVGTVRYIAKYLRTGMPLVRKRVTIDGGAVVNPCNVNVPIGAMIMDIIEATGGIKETPAKIIMGGPMMGISIDKAETGILKNNNAILLLNSVQAATPQESACIRCSRCIDACPMNLIPTSIDLMVRTKDIEGLQKFSAMDCIECGCCSFTCPSKRYLTQSIRSGKQILRSAAPAK
ncbi:MAG: electron transport complex subunit RsxC [Saccharofermentanales bacterium]